MTNFAFSGARRRVLTACSVGAAVVIALLVMAVADGSLGNAALSGIGSGVIVGSIGLSVVLCFRSGGVVNFSLAAQAMYATYVFDELRRKGELFLPPIPNPLSVIEWVLNLFGVHVGLWDIPTRISLGVAPMTVTSAFLITIVMAAAFGYLLDLLVFRPLRSSPPLASVAASVGLLLLMQGIISVRFDTQAHPLAPILAKGRIDLPFGLFAQRDQLTALVLLVVVAGALAALSRFTRFGILTRAASENQVGFSLQGHSPNAVIATNWIISACISSFFGVMVTSINGAIDPTVFGMLIVPALAAAMIGGFSGYGATIAAAIGIAMLQAIFVRVTNYSWFPRPGGVPLPGISEVIPLILIATFLFVRGDKLPTRGSAGSDRLPHAPQPTKRGVAVVVGVVVALAGTFGLTPAWRLGLGNTLVGIAVCLALVLIVGYTGQLSLMVMSLAGVSGFAVARLGGAVGLPFPVGPIIAIGVAALVGVLASIPALRVRGTNLAILTLSAAIVFEVFIFSNAKWMGGAGAVAVGSPSIFGWDFGPNVSSSLGRGGLPNPWFGVFLLIVVTLLALVVGNVRLSNLGRRMLAVRSNERAAAAVGISASGTKLLAALVSAAVAGVAGVLAAYNLTAVSPGYFGSVASISFLAFAYLGGISSISGALTAGLFVPGGLGATAMERWFHVPPAYLLVVAGVGLIVTAILNPEGIAKEVRKALPFRRRATRPPVRPVGGTGAGKALPTIGHRAPTRSGREPAPSTTHTRKERNHAS